MRSLYLSIFTVVIQYNYDILPIAYKNRGSLTDRVTQYDVRRFQSLDSNHRAGHTNEE